MKAFFIFILVYRLHSSPIIPVNNALYPVLLIPGDGGSHLEARLNKSYAPHYVCDKYTTEWFNIWLNLELLMPYVIDCWVDNVKLNYDPVTHTTRNTIGVDIRVPGFGNTTTIEWIDPNQRSVSRYFASIVDKLVTMGLVRGVSIRGAPYDFRKTPLENEELFKNMIKLVEDMYKSFNATPLVLICHSMGCIYIKYWLQTMPTPWKSKYIKAWITLSSPWAGTVKALKMFAAGDNLDAYPLNALKIRDSQRTYPSLAWLLPRREFWADNETIATTPAKNYSVREMDLFFKDINLTDPIEMWKDNRDLIDLQRGPGGVELHCLYGVNVSTPERLIWSRAKDFPDRQPLIGAGDGDGSVNYRSLDACSRWNNLPVNLLDGLSGLGRKARERVIRKTFPLVEHVHILYNKDVIDYIASVVSGQPPPTHHYGPFKTFPEDIYADERAFKPDTSSHSLQRTLPWFFLSIWQNTKAFFSWHLEESNLRAPPLVPIPSPPLFFPLTGVPKHVGGPLGNSVRIVCNQSGEPFDQQPSPLHTTELLLHYGVSLLFCLAIVAIILILHKSITSTYQRVSS